jgi:anti-anti-sigma factor
MQFILEQAEGRVPVSILGLHGSLDASTYESFVARAREAYDGGARNLLVDMREVSFMSSAGLSALHQVATLYRGEALPSAESRWEALQDVYREQPGGGQQHVKLLAPQPQVARIFKMTGLAEVFEIHEEREAAIASFGQ